MREYCINTFNRIYHLDYTLKAKEFGRNIDINSANMSGYNKYKKQFKELNNKVDELQNKSNEINDILDSLKPTIINKSNLTISNDDVIKIKTYIEKANDTTSNLKEANDITIILNKYDDNLKEYSKEVQNLQKKRMIMRYSHSYFNFYLLFFNCIKFNDYLLI